MPQCPAFILTSSSPDVFNTELVDNNSYAHYVVRTLDMHNGTRLSPSSPSRANTVRLRPSLQCSSAARNPTIIVHPKSSSSEAKIVASLQWSHWPDSIFSTRWQAVRLEKVIPLKDSSFTPNAPREFPTSKGVWRWCSSSGQVLRLLDASGETVAYFDEHGSLSASSDDFAGLPQLQVEYKALDLLDLVVCSLLVVVHEQQQPPPLRDSTESDDAAPIHSWTGG